MSGKNELKYGIKPPEEGKIRKKRRIIRVDKMNLTHPQQEAIKLLVQGQRNKYKKLLHETHERMHVISDHQYGLELWLGLTGAYEYISPSCERITGYTKSDFTDQVVTFDTFIHPEYLERFNADRQLSLEGISNIDVEYRWIHKDGSTHWALATWSPVYTRRGRHIGTRLSIRDTTLEKLYARESDAARESCRRLAAVVGFVCICDAGGVIRSLPPAIPAPFDRSNALRPGAPIAGILGPDSVAAIGDAFTGIHGGEVSADLTVRLAAGLRTKEASVHLFAFHSSGPVTEVFLTVTLPVGAA